MFIIYQQPNGMTAVISPAPCGLSVQEIARKDVPHGIPYLIVDALPDSPPETWDVDYSAPSGIGLGARRWFIERARAERNDDNAEECDRLIAQMQAELLAFEGATE